MIERFAGRYALVKRLGQGGMGEVFLARDLATGAECALKRMVAAPIRGDALDPGVMLREFEALTRVRHPTVVAVHELGFAPDGAPYFTMEYVPGLAADRALVRGDWPALFFTAAQVAHGLEALHAAGVCHGDLKPSNLLVVPGLAPDALPAGVRLVDFGLAGLLGQTMRGHRGTPGYAAPEVVRGESPGPAADLYGLGATLYTLVAGRAAFSGHVSSELLQRQQAGPPPALALEEAGAPPALVQLVLRLMAPLPVERPRDAREVRRELERIHPAARRPLAERLQTVVVVGRERELALLERRLAQPGRRARVVVLDGEPGAGKSAVLGELAARATLAGRSVVQLSCASFETQGELALALMRRLAADAGADPSTLPLPARNAATAEESLGAMADAAAEWTRAIAERSGAPLLLLDDGEAVDPLSRAFVRRLVLHPAAAPSLWVWARRPLPDGAPEDERALIEAGVAEPLALGPLDAEGAARLAAVRLGDPAPASLLEFLWARAGGHPGLTLELLRAAAAAGAVEESDAGLLVRAERLAEVRVPASFEESLLERLGALPPPARAAAAALAAWGRPADEARVAALEPAAAGGCEALLAAGLAARDAAGRLRLAPPALSARLLEGVAPEARSALHRAALAADDLSPAERFRHLRGAGDARGALAVAGSPEAAGDETLAIEAAALAETEAPDMAAVRHEVAARLLAARGRYGQAIPHLERALALEPAGEARPRRWAMLATACFRAGRPAEVARVVERALAEDPPPAMRARLLVDEAARLHAEGQLQPAFVAAGEAVSLAAGTSDDEAMGHAALTLAAVLLESGHLEEAEEQAQRAMRAYERCGLALGRIRAMVNSAAIAGTRGKVDEAERLCREAVAEARERGARVALEEALMRLAALLLQTGRWSATHEALTEAVRIALEDGRARSAAIAVASLAMTEGLAGRPRAARRQARAAIRLARASLPAMEPQAWRALALAHRIAGRPGRSERAARHALSLAMRRGTTDEIRWCRIELARLLAGAGRWKEAGELCERALEGDRTSEAGAIVLAALAGRAALRLGAAAAATKRLADAETRLRGAPAPYAAALVEQLRAESALAGRRTAEGIECARRALDALAALPAPADRALALLDFARLALAADSETRAPVLAWLEEAAGAFERFGDRRNRERALAYSVQWLRESLATRPAAAADRSLLDAVSRLLHSLPDLRELTRRAMRLAVEQLGAERGVLLLADPESGRLEPMAEYGAVDATTRRDAVGYSRRVVERVTRGGSALLIGDAPSDPRAVSQSVTDLGLRSIVCVPMFLRGKVVGAVYLDDSRRPDAFGENERALLDGFAQLMAVAIENSRGQQEVERANERLVEENLSLRREVGARFRTQKLVAASSAMQQVIALIEQAARSDSTMLLTGENGTGKELIARVLHHSGKRALGPFVAVNCGAIPETLLETELFGILANVATGVRARVGRFVQAHGGTLFLDEIGEMPLQQQVALLSAISNREITPVGGGDPIHVDVRIIAATNRDVGRMLEEGAFREDLYYRLNVIPLEVPPLRARKADIPAMARLFVEQFAAQQEREAPELSPEFLAALMQSDWPGNVRELQNYIERVLALNPGRVLHPNPLPRDLESRGEDLKLGRARRLAEVVGKIERKVVAEALERAGGNQSHAARELGMSEASIRYRIRRYGLATRQNPRTRKKPRAR
ncbi:MAG: sigma 54-interacting transcriptional regulator [Candidatus Eisenbacteria bacterium]|nr:sigma 54-interacting transcriptional regulator [Candidatus Eisenbacteria bacterium]